MQDRHSREYELELPVGYADDDGRVHRSALLKKMTGHEEALLTDRKLRKNGGRLVTELLSRCIRRLGDLEPVSTAITAAMTSPDRNFLLLELRRITFGEEMDARYTCPVCQTTMERRECLEEVPVRRVDGGGAPDITVQLEDGYEDAQGHVHTTMVFRLPTGRDEERIAPEMKDNPSKGVNALLARCLKTVGDMPDAKREALGTRLIADLTMPDRLRIERAMRQQMPGVDLRRSLECDECGHTFDVTLDLTSFFSLR
jgi:hypothetical protein